MRLPAASAVLLAIASSLTFLPAQALTASVSERMSGFLHAEQPGAAAPARETIAASRAFPAAQVFVVQSGVASGSMGFFPGASGPFPSLAVQIGASADTLNSAAGATVSSSADFVLQLAATQPVRGILAIRLETVPSGGAYGVGDFQVDIDDDNTVDLRGNLAAPPFVAYGEFARSFGPGALAVHMTHTGQLMVPPWFIGEYRCNLSVRWIPDTGAIAAYGQGCGLTLREERLGNGEISFFLGWGGPVNANTWLLMGLHERNVVLPLPPGCLQLTDMDAVCPFGATGVVLPWLPLPPAFLIHVQAVEFASQSTLTSNGLRLTVGT